jgi:hypothetical protein
MSNLKVFLGIFLALSVSRFIPHPPNFTSLIALSFYVPAILGLKFLPIVLISFIITDLFIGFHNTLIFTWGSVLLIGLISNYFRTSLYLRIAGVIGGACLFFILTNFGVWTLGSYGYTLSGLLNCYLLALPFFGNTVISSLICLTIIETILKFFNTYKQKTH